MAPSGPNFASQSVAFSVHSDCVDIQTYMRASLRRACLCRSDIYAARLLANGRSLFQHLDDSEFEKDGLAAAGRRYARNSIGGH